MNPVPEAESEKGVEAAISSQSGDSLSTPVRNTPIARWLTRNHAWISGAGGTLLLLIAVLAPVIAPSEQRGEIGIVTVLLGLTGALMLYAAIETAVRTAGSTKSPATRTTRRDMNNPLLARKALLRNNSRQKVNRALAGLIFGLLFLAAGIVAPFVLGEGQDNPDARFLMVIGFSPVAISGALMVYLFGKVILAALAIQLTPARLTAVSIGRGSSETLISTLATVCLLSGMLLTACAVILPFIVGEAMRTGIAVPAAVMGGLGMGLSLLATWLTRRESGTEDAQTIASVKPTQRRLPVPRIPSGILYRVFVPGAIGLLFLLIVAVILVLVAATVTPLIR